VPTPGRHCQSLLQAAKTSAASGHGGTPPERPLSGFAHGFGTGARHQEAGVDVHQSRASRRPQGGATRRLARLTGAYYDSAMKTLTVRLPEGLVAEIEAECRERQRSKSDVVRERLTLAGGRRSRRVPPAVIADLVGSVDGLPADLSGRKKAYLKSMGYGRKRAR
jgi:hypothetical protein